MQQTTQVMAGRGNSLLSWTILLQCRKL